MKLADSAVPAAHPAGRIRQVPLFLAKFGRLFIYMDDWKVIPMSALVAGLVAFVVSRRMGRNMEGTYISALALACVCIWNGFFNSIQSVCRERDIIKREHRCGMHVSAYITAQMIYQALICLVQCLILLIICRRSGMVFPDTGVVTGNFNIDIMITLFLITYASDMLALFISCLSRTETSAMTVMPFMLIFELTFSDTVFKLPSSASFLTSLSFAKWGVRCIAAEAQYNSQPMVSAWEQLKRLQGAEISGMTPVADVVQAIEEQNKVDDFTYWLAANSQNEDLASTVNNVGNCWVTLMLFAVLFALFSIIVLKRIDRDRR